MLDLYQIPVLAQGDRKPLFVTAMSTESMLTASTQMITKGCVVPGLALGASFSSSLYASLRTIRDQAYKPALAREADAKLVRPTWPEPRAHDTGEIRSRPEYPSRHEAGSC